MALQEKQAAQKQIILLQKKRYTFYGTKTGFPFQTKNMVHILGIKQYIQYIFSTKNWYTFM